MAGAQQEDQVTEGLSVLLRIYNPRQTLAFYQDLKITFGQLLILTNLHPNFSESFRQLLHQDRLNPRCTTLANGWFAIPNNSNLCQTPMPLGLYQAYRT